MKSFNFCVGLLLLFISSKCAASLLLINELHYDNAGSDKGEFVEVIATEGTDLIDWSLLFYNGGNGKVYKTVQLHGKVSNQANGYGVKAFVIGGLQNGAPDGVALVNHLTNDVSDFISYEGSFIATNGLAKGLASYDINVTEPPNTPIGFSLQRKSIADNSLWHLTESSIDMINAQQIAPVQPTSVPTPSSIFCLVIGISLLTVSRLLHCRRDIAQNVITK